MKKRKTFMDIWNAYKKPGKLDEDQSYWRAQWRNELTNFTMYLFDNPGLTRFELARGCKLDDDYDFRKAISYLKFTGQIYEDTEGFFYVKNISALHY